MTEKNLRYFTYTIVIFFLVVFSIGCAPGGKLLTIAHEPLNPVGNKKDGKILIKQFVSKAEPIQPTGVMIVIGSEEEKERNKRIREKMIESERISLGMLITSFFGEALEEAGYQVVFQEDQYPTFLNQTKFDAIIAGEIWGFNIEESNLFLYSKMWVKIEALDPINKKVLWRKQFIGEEKKVSNASIAPEAEYNRVIRQAATKALNQAAAEFASDEFYKAIKRSETSNKNGSKQQRQYKR